jgi:hypothetical protein
MGFSHRDEMFERAWGLGDALARLGLAPDYSGDRLNGWAVDFSRTVTDYESRTPIEAETVLLIVRGQIVASCPVFGSDEALQQFFGDVRRWAHQRLSLHEDIVS